MRTRLTTGEAAAFKAKVWPMLRLLTRARKRIDELGFDPKSKLYVTVGKAQDALQALHTELHYESIAHGVGKPPGGDEPPPAQAGMGFRQQRRKSNNLFDYDCSYQFLLR